MTKDKEVDALFRIMSSNIEQFKVCGEDDVRENADVLVCLLKTEPLLFPDNLLGHCAQCFRMVQFRPDAPKLIRRLCAVCVEPLIAADPNRQFRITEQTANDLANFMLKKGSH